MIVINIYYIFHISFLSGFCLKYNILSYFFLLYFIILFPSLSLKILKKRKNVVQLVNDFIQKCLYFIENDNNGRHFSTKIYREFFTDIFVEFSTIFG